MKLGFSLHKKLYNVENSFEGEIFSNEIMPKFSSGQFLGQSHKASYFFVFSVFIVKQIFFLSFCYLGNL